MMGAMTEANLNLLWARLLVAELVKNGLDTFFVSPGNRNAPLLAALALDAGSSNISVTSGIDERAAAFCALGHARATGRAGVVICTSGTAAANYYPAVIEAARDHLPLVIVSADRPPERVFSDANQSIEQTGLFGRFISQTLNLPCPSDTFPLEALLTGIDHLVSHRHEPVHINLPLPPPLVPVPQPLPDTLRHTFRRLLARPTPYTRYAALRKQPENMDEVLEVLAGAHRGLLVWGRLDPEDDRQQSLSLISQLNWPVLCDMASGLKWRCEAGIQLCPPDQPAALALLRRYQPDVILQLGSGLVSKAWYHEFLPTSPAHLIQVSPRAGLRDPAHRVHTRLTLSVSAFISGLSPKLIFRSEQPDHTDQAAKALLLKGMQHLHRELQPTVSSEVLSFAGLAARLHHAIPAQEALFLGNSLTIRVFDMLPPDVYKPVEVVTQRGVSGIEGHLATSVGYAQASGRRTTAVLGDIALLHDLNSLLLVARSSTPVIVIVVNNRGGRIFERLPAADFSDLLAPWMITPHDMDIAPLAEKFGLPVWSCRTPAEFDTCYHQALALNTSGLLEVHIIPEADLATYRRQQAVTDVIEV